MAINLSRNSKVFFTTNINSTTGAVYPTGLTPNNTFELQVLDGFTFSQNTNAETITVSESGGAPTRGQRSFNTSLAPVDYSFSTYIRPNTVSGVVTAEESVLWNALLSAKAITNTPTPIVLGGSPINGVASSVGTVSSITYTGATAKITVSGLGLPAGGLAAGDTVVLGGMLTSAGYNASYMNALATVDAIPTTSSYVFTLVNNPGTTATTISNTSISITKVNTATAALNTAAIIGTGGTGTMSSASYAYNTTTGVGTLTITGGSLPVIPVDASTTTYYTLTGINTVPSSTPAGATAAVYPSLNSTVYIAQQSDSVVGSLKLTYVTPPTAHTSLTWSTAPATTLKLLNGSWGENAANAYIGTPGSDQNQLQKFGMLFLVDNVLYSVDNCALTQVTVDYGLDQITTAQWTGQGTALNKISDATSTGLTTILTSVKAGYFVKSTGQVGEVTGAFTPKDTTAKYITNKLTTLKLTSLYDVKDATNTTQIAAATDFNVAVTGGSFTINNNINYLTPNILSTVNIPAAYFVGTRAITGTITAYLKTGATGDTGDLLDGLLAGSSVSTEPMFAYTANIGGATAPYIQLSLPTVFLQIPTVDVQQVVSTTINFTAEGSSVIGGTTVFDVLKSNDATLRYYN